MTPREHYVRAEQILEKVEERLNAINAPIEAVQSDAILSVDIGFCPELLLAAAVHARLATGNLENY